MAAFFLSAKEMRGISSLSGVINEKLVEILCSQDSTNHAEIAKQITSGFTKAALIEARRKIFDVAISKEKEVFSLATGWNDAASVATEEQAVDETGSVQERRLVNRSTKPKLAEDIMQIALFIDNPELDFPRCTMKCATTKNKPTSDKEARSEPSTPTSSGNPSSKDDTGGNRRSPRSVHGNTSAPNASLQAQFERFVIRESNIDKAQNSTDISAAISEVRDYSSSTVELIVFRSFATQTDAVEILPDRVTSEPPASNGTDIPIQEKLVVAPVPDHTAISPQKDPNRVSAEQSVLSNTGGANKSTPSLSKSHGNHSTPCEATINSKDTTEDLDSSLFDYIDEEFRSLQDKNPEMCAAKRGATSDRNQDRRIATLEAKYDKVVKRLDFVEKDHTKELCEIRAELRRIAYANPDSLRENTSSSLYNESRVGRHSRRHSSGDITAPPGDCTDSYDSVHPDDSVWDVSLGDPVVLTQDSQGKSIMTKATPMHKREMAVANENGAKKRGSASMNRESAYELRDRPQGRNGQSTSAGSGNSQPTNPASTRQNVNKEKTGATGADAPYGQRNEKPSTKQTSDNRSVPSCSYDRSSDETNAAKKRKTFAGNTPPDAGPSTSRGQPERQQSKQGNTANRNNETRSNDASNNDSESYAESVTKYPWKTQSKDKGKKRVLPMISGLDDTENKEMFVRGLKCADFRNRKDLEDSVKYYCKERDINLVHQRVLGFKVGRVTVGCKIVVKNADVDKIATKGFWPAKVWIREWYDDPQEEIPSGNDSSSCQESD